MTQRLTLNEVQERFTVTPAMRGNLVDCTKWTCLVCGDKFERPYGLIRKRGGCPTCMKIARADRAKIKRTAGRKILLLKTLKVLKHRFDGRIKLNQNSYVCNDKQAQFKCVCGNVWWAFVKSTLKMKYGCNACATLEAAYRKNLKVFKLCRTKLHNIGFDVLTKSIPKTRSSRSTRVRVRCRKCRHTTKTKLYALPRRHCCRRCLNGGNHYSKRKVTVFGKSFMVSGYEHFAVKWIAENTKYEIQHITSSNLPVFKYTENGKRRLYTPDIKAGKNIVEVKSTYTLGLFMDKLFKNVQLKAKSVLRSGYVFKLMMFEADGTRIRIPRNWLSLSRLDMIHALERLNSNLDLTRFAKYRQTLTRKP